MKSISSGAMKWAAIASEEINRQRLPFPPELILALVDCESGGISGVVNPKSGASGLMQVMPIALESFNSVHSVKYDISDLRDSSNPVAQIRVGTWILGQFWRNAFDYLSKRLQTIPIDELARISDLFYAAGPRAVKEKLETLPVPIYNAVRSKYPKWNALPHPERVFDKVSIQTISEIAVNKWLENSAKTSIVYGKNKAAAAGTWLTAAILSALIGWAVHYFLQKFRR